MKKMISIVVLFSVFLTSFASSAFANNNAAEVFKDLISKISTECYEFGEADFGCEVAASITKEASLESFKSRVDEDTSSTLSNTFFMLCFQSCMHGKNGDKAKNDKFVKEVNKQIDEALK